MRRQFNKKLGVLTTILQCNKKINASTYHHFGKFLIELVENLQALLYANWYSTLLIGNRAGPVENRPSANSYYFQFHCQHIFLE